MQEQRDKLVSAVSERQCALRPIHREMIRDNPSVGVETGLSESSEALDAGAPIAGALGAPSSCWDRPCGVGRSVVATETP